MALPASGAISLNNVNVELGLSGTATIGMNDAAVRTLFAKSGSGTTISMSDGYGKSANTSDPNFSQVSLLLHLNGANGSTTFTDNSPVGCSFGANNSAALSTVQAKFGNASLSLNGTSYLTNRTDTSNAFVFGTGDFTIELFAYFTAINPTTLLFDNRPGANGPYSVIYMSNSGILRYFVGTNRIAGPLLTTGTWYHIAVARSGTSTKMFLNGTQVGETYTDTNDYTSGGSLRPLIGASAFGGTFGTNGVIGYIDEVRVTKGFARYTANTTAPTAEFPNF